MVAKRNIIERASEFRNFIFGVEDSLVSTVGLLSGVAIANVERSTIILTGIVLIFVEAFSMGVGSYLSESSEEDFLKKKVRIHNNPLLLSLVMFVSYFISGFIPLAPYLFLLPETAFMTSIGVALTALFFLGLWSGRMVGSRSIQSAFRMLLIGGLAILIGVGAGYFVNQFTG